ncbi:MAG TPA: peptide chain release factor N(5)-glutamine methyltransferase [Acidimicrobiales bacterium]|nr:peptide chain release factor N(5)-glutamine methyltransferase [Acidimicrobiales bacterium]
MPSVESRRGPGTTERGDRRPALLASVADRLGSAREARWILEFVEAESQAPLAAGELHRQVEALVARRGSGEPLQYVLGRWPFRSLELTVDPRVLIPRPETEQVVEVALAELARICADPAVGPPTGALVPSVVAPVCVDLGTGSGAIALALATEAGPRFPAIEVWATDASADALEVAGQNLGFLSRRDAAAGARVRLAQGSWLAALPTELMGRVDLIVANPPYVSVSEYADLDPEVRDWEPKEALVAPSGAGGVGGTADIEEIVGTAPRWLRSGGGLVVEIAPAQAPTAIDAALRAAFASVTHATDLTGRIRMLVARR